MKWLALTLIRCYQRTLSRVLPPSCRFVPSCSEYGYEAITRYGVIRGGALAAWRVARCNPWGGHGYDPVPDLAERAETSPLKWRVDRQGPGGTCDPHSFPDTALTPRAPGHSLTEG